MIFEFKIRIEAEDKDQAWGKLLDRAHASVCIAGGVENDPLEYDQVVAVPEWRGFDDEMSMHTSRRNKSSNTDT